MSGSKNYRIFLLACLLLFALAAACSDETPIEHVDNNTSTNNANNSDKGDDAGNNGGQDTDGIPPELDDSGVAILIDERDYLLTDGFSDPITVEVPPNTISMTITVQGHNSEMYGIGYWTGPNDFSLIPKNWERNNYSQMCFKNCNNRIVLAEATFAALAPNNPESKVEPGQHTFAVYGMFPQDMMGFTPSNREVRVSVHIKVREELPTTGVLDLNLYFTGSNGWTAETAKTDAAFQQIISQVDTIYQSVGVRLGELTYQDIDARYKVIESVTGPDSDLMELFAQSSQSRMNAVNLFFVDELTLPPMPGGGGGGTILGIAGGIPGPPLTQGTSKSGVAVISKPIPGGPGIASVVAHEAGHFLGLFHTTEHENPLAEMIGMPKHDPLPDTPEFDETYLMHAGGSGNKLSPWQGRIIRSNPWVRHTEQAQ